MPFTQIPAIRSFRLATIGLIRRAQHDNDVVDFLVGLGGTAEIDAAEDEDLDAGEIRLDGDLAGGDVGHHLFARRRRWGGLGRMSGPEPKAATRRARPSAVRIRHLPGEA